MLNKFLHAAGWVNAISHRYVHTPEILSLQENVSESLSVEGRMEKLGTVMHTFCILCKLYALFILVKQTHRCM